MISSPSLDDTSAPSLSLLENLGLACVLRQNSINRSSNLPLSYGVAVIQGHRIV